MKQTGERLPHSTSDRPHSSGRHAQRGDDQATGFADQATILIVEDEKGVRNLWQGLEPRGLQCPGSHVKRGTSIRDMINQNGLKTKDLPFFFSETICAYGTHPQGSGKPRQLSFPMARLTCRNRLASRPSNTFMASVWNEEPLLVSPARDLTWISSFPPPGPWISVKSA